MEQAYDISRLRKRARGILDTSKATNPKRPVFVEFSGTPKSGKSTCIDIVAHFFRRLGFRTLAPTEGASKRTPYYLKNDLTAFNAWSACYALSHILEATYHSDRYHLALLDRGLFDALVWFDLLAGDKKISRKDCHRIQRFLLIDKWSSAVDKVFLFKADPDTSIERENRDKLVSDPGMAMNHDFLTKLNGAYDRVHEKFSREFRRVQVIDTSGAARSTPRTTAFEIVSSILDLFPKA